ncbi:MAG TPA: Bcr/CflA family efflux MFS transporter [Acetobacteraceae bacterium]
MRHSTDTESTTAGQRRTCALNRLTGRPAPFSLLVAITACGTIGMHLVVPALPATADALSVSPATIQLTITLYIAGLAIGQLLYGPVSDRFGRRPVLLAGLALFTVAGIAATASTSATTLIVSRILQAVGGCAGLVLGRAIVRDSASADRAAARLALLTLVMSLAPAIAPAIGGYAVTWAGWRSAFALLALIGVVTTLLTALWLPETNAPAASRGRVPLLLSSVRLLRSPAFCGFSLGGACTTTSFYAFMAASPFIFEDVLHQSTERIGLYYLLLMLGLAAGGFTANRLAGRVAISRVLPLANALAMLGAAWFLLAWQTGHFGVVVAIASVALFMMGAGIASPFALTAAVSVNPQAIGAASGLYGFIQMSYGALCTIVVEAFDSASVTAVGLVMLGSALGGQIALSFGLRARR